MIEFNEATHEYFNDGKKLISVTQLMRKHGLAPDYSMVNQAVLNAKAERGSLIHKEIENYIKNGEFGFTTELEAFQDYLSETDVKVLESEIIAYNDIVAGTADLVLDYNGKKVIADIKTTATLHKESVSWQLSIYAVLLGYGITEGKAFHFDKDGNLNVVDIPLKPFTEVERLMECERKGETYTQALIVPETQLARLADLEAIIQECEERKKKAKADAKELRTALLGAMEKGAVKSFENERLRVTYVAPYSKSMIDSAKLKKEMPEIAQKYTKKTQVKAFLEITLKGGEDDEF